MILLVAITLYVLGLLLGIWGLTLLRRAWRTRRTVPGVRVSRTGARQPRTLLALFVGLAAIPLGVTLIMVGDSARRGFEGWDNISGDAFGLGAAIVCWVFAALLLYAGVRFDPAAGRRRCPRCWYDMSATPGLRCPECGREARSERRLRRTRRSRVLVCAAPLLALTPYGIVIGERVHDHGWIAATPTTALILGLPWLTDDMVFRGGGNLVQRIAAEPIPEWQADLLEWRRRRMAAHSTDPRALWICALIGRMGDEPPLAISQEGVDALVRAALSDDDRQRAMGITVLLWWGPGMTAERAAQYRDRAASAMESREPGRAAVGAALVRYLGDAGFPAAPALTDLALDERADDDARRMAVVSLAGFAAVSERAWEGVERVLRETSGPTRIAAYRAAGAIQSDKHVAQLRAILREEMGALSPESASAAAVALVRISPDPSALVSELVEFLRERPDVDPILIDALAQRVQNEQLARVVERMLISDQIGEQAAGAMACRRFGASGKRFLEVLRAFKRYEGLPDSRWSWAQDSIKEIEAAVESDR